MLSSYSSESGVLVYQPPGESVQRYFEQDESNTHSEPFSDDGETSRVLEKVFSRVKVDVVQLAMLDVLSRQSTKGMKNINKYVFKRDNL